MGDSTQVPVDPKAAKLVEEALALMNDEGKHWVKGAFRHISGDKVSYCAVGAIRQVVFGSVDLFPAHKQEDELNKEERATMRRYYTVMDAVTVALGRSKDPDFIGKGSAIVGVNDAPSTTFEDIQAGFRKAARLLRGK